MPLEFVSYPRINGRKPDSTIRRVCEHVDSGAAVGGIAGRTDTVQIQHVGMSAVTGHIGLTGNRVFVRTRRAVAKDLTE